MTTIYKKIIQKIYEHQLHPNEFYYIDEKFELQPIDKYSNGEILAIIYTGKQKPTSEIDALLKKKFTYFIFITPSQREFIYENMNGDLKIIDVIDHDESKSQKSNFFTVYEK